MTGSNPAQAAILAEVAAERRRQDSRWGGAPHDDSHNAEEWVALLIDQLGGASSNRRIKTLWRIYLLQLAATAVAAVESFDRKYPGVGGMDPAMTEPVTFRHTNRGGVNRIRQR